MKSIFKSKTFWANVLTGVGAAGSGWLGFEINPQIAGPLVAGVNIALRYITAAPTYIIRPNPNAE